MNGRCHFRPVSGTAKIIFALPVVLTAALVLTAVQPAMAQPGSVLSHQKISDFEGGFGELDVGDEFGYSVASLGDLDGDGVVDLAVGARLDDDGGENRGAVWVLFLNKKGAFKSHQKISSTEGGFTGALDDGETFGVSVASLGDLDGDGVGDLAVGASRDDDGGRDRGAVWVLFLNKNGTVKSHQKISSTEGGFTGSLNDGEGFGDSLASLGDLNGDGVGDLAVGVPWDSDGGWGRGAVWVLFLNRDGTVKSHQKISDTEGGFRGRLHDGDWFGDSVASLGDVDEDGVRDLVVGARNDDDNGENSGAVWVLFLNKNGTVKSHQKISGKKGGLKGKKKKFDRFGSSVAALGDLDDDGVVDVAVGSSGDWKGGQGLNTGAVWLLFLNRDGTVKSEKKHSNYEGGLKGKLRSGDSFGSSVAMMGDLDGDGVSDLGVGANRAALFGEGSKGALWVLFLERNGTIKSHRKTDYTRNGFDLLEEEDLFGFSVASLGDLNGDRSNVLAVGIPGDDDGGEDRGAVQTLFLQGDGWVESHQKISATEGGFTGLLDDGDEFGFSVASLGDLDNDGVNDLAVGAPGDDSDGCCDRGALWILFLNKNGTVKAHQKISDTEGGFTGSLDDFDRFGGSMVSLGDLDGDGVGDLAVGAFQDDDGGKDRGAVWVLFLNRDGTVKSHQKISDTEGGFTGILDDADWFGISVNALGDLDGDDVADLAVGAYGDDDGGADHGAVWMLFLNQDGTVKSHQKISNTEGGFTGTLDDDDLFGSSVVSLGDFDSDGVTDLAVGALGDDDGGVDRGAVWLLFLHRNGSVKYHRKISSKKGDFAGKLDDGDSFGVSLASVGDLDRDGTVDLAVGAYLDDDGGDQRGAVWMLFFNGACTGNEILEANCEPRRRGGMIKATLMQGQQRTTVTFRLDGNSKTDIRKTVKKNGNAKAKFKHVPKGELTVELLVCNRQTQTVCR